MKAKLSRRKSVYNTLVIITINFLFVIILSSILLINFNNYKNDVEENCINEITLINESIGDFSYNYIVNKKNIVSGIQSYLSDNNCTVEEAIDYIEIVNQTNKDNIQLIESSSSYGVGFDPKTSQTIGIYYLHNDSEALKKTFAHQYEERDLNIITQFTDMIVPEASVALFERVNLRGNFPAFDINEVEEEYRCDDVDETVTRDFVLMCSIKISDFNKKGIWNSKYEHTETMIIDASGGYILKLDTLAGKNFFTYLFYNENLENDQINKLKDTIFSCQENSGHLKISDSNQVEKVYVFSSIVKTLGWYAITVVPTASLSNEKARLDLTSTFVIAGFSIAFLVFNLLWLTSFNKRLRNNIKELDEASKAKSDFLSRMSHDMRTPMNGILGFSELGTDSQSLGEAIEYLEKINISGKYLLNLINDTLDMSKIESGKISLNLVPVNFKKYIQNICDSFITAYNNKNITIDVFIIGQADCNVLLDEVRVQQIINNILSNAYKFTPENGLIKIFINCSSINDNKLKCAISIQDNGIGMEEEFLKHIYEPFSQENVTRNYNMGTGLGMAIVKNLIELMNGSLNIESKKNIGTTVSINLLFDTTEIKELNKIKITMDTSILKNKRILIAEDNTVNIIIIKRLLEKVGIIAEVGEDGLIAYNMFMKHDPDYYDLILMDIRMPVWDGLETTEKIRKSDHPKATTIPIIAMTANAFDTDVKACLEVGMNAHLGKPIDTNKLYQTLIEQLKK